MTTMDSIVYSQILYRSLWDTNASFTQDGEFSLSYHQEEGGGYVELGWSVNESLAKELNISRRQYYQSRKNLQDAGYISKDGVLLLDGVTDTFFELKVDCGMRGMALIAYSYLFCKSKKYGWVDKYHKAIADDLHIPERSFQRILAKLIKWRLVETKEGWKQTLLRTT